MRSPSAGIVKMPNIGIGCFSRRMAGEIGERFEEGFPYLCGKTEQLALSLVREIYPFEVISPDVIGQTAQRPLRFNS